MRGGSERFIGKVLVFHFKESSLKCSRLGISVPKKFGMAVHRNRLKRELREVFRLRIKEIPVCFDIHVNPQRGISGFSYDTKDAVREDFLMFLELLGSRVDAFCLSC